MPKTRTEALDLSQIAVDYASSGDFEFLDPQLISHIQKDPIFMCPFSADDVISTTQSVN